LLRGARAKRRDGVEQFAALVDHPDANILEVLGSQPREHFNIYRVIAKRRCILLQSKALQPTFDLHFNPQRIVFLLSGDALPNKGLLHLRA
jgi:hypothetical protein